MSHKVPMQEKVITWLNGRSVAGVSPLDRGLQYGDGLFETILGVDNKLILKDQHLARLARDCKRLNINLDINSLLAELDDFFQIVNADIFLIKIIITRQSQERGYSFSKLNTANRILQLYSVPAYSGSNQNGIKVSLSRLKLSHQPALAGIKHLNRLEQVLASSHWNKSIFQEMLMQDQLGYIIEGLFSNVFIVKNNQLITPLLTRCGVKGVMRDYLIEALAPSLKIDVFKKNIFLADLLGADEVFLCNSVYGIWPVVALDVKSFSIGPISKCLQERINALGYNRVYC